ncbi:transposon ty3-G gag-pol polyprotein [Tanacetum coccineum]
MGVEMFRPKILADAYSLTNYQEATLEAVKKKSKIAINFAGGRVGNGMGQGSHSKQPLLSLPVPNTKKRVGCPVTSTCPLAVTLGGNKQLISASECKNFEWQLQGETFNTDMMILTLGVCKMVLGIQWLATHGDIKCNFSQLRMELMYKNKRMTLRCTLKAAMHLMDGKHQSKNFKIGNKGDAVLIPELDKVVQDFDDVFALTTELPPQRIHDHRIPLIPNAQPVNIRPYRHPPMQKDAIEVMVKELLDSGVIKPSNSPFASPIVMELHGATIFSKLDLRSGYLQIKMYKDDIAKTAFKTHQGHFKFPVMPFGLTNSPSTCQALMNENTLFAKKSKCVFGTSHVEYLGHVIYAEGVATDPSKISAMVEWPTPTNVKQLRGFLGLTDYYRRFIKSFAKISRTLSQLLKKGRYKLSNEAQLAFKTLKEAMMKALVLALPDFTQPFVVKTIASGVGIRAMLQQKGHPIAYMSKNLSLKHQSLSTYEKEFLAVLLDLDKWRGYLLDRHFIIKTNHFSLKYLLDQRITTLTQMKWLPKSWDLTMSLITTLVTIDLAKKTEDSWVEDRKLLAIIVQLRAGQGGKKHYTWSNNQLLRKGKTVPNILPTLPTLDPDLDFTPSHDSLGSGNKIFDPGIFIEVQSERLLSWDEISISFIRDPISPVFDTLLPFSSKNEDKVFNPSILTSHILSHRDKIISDFSKSPMNIYGRDIPHLDVPFLSPLIKLKYGGSSQAM